jgi:hypothetical protein
MENITSTAGLKKAIELLEAEQAVKLQQLKEQFYPAYESLKPVNLFKNTLKDINFSPYLIENIIGTALGLATGYFSKRLVVGASVNWARKLFGAIMQFGIANVVTKHSDTIKSYSRYFFDQIFHKKEHIFQAKSE